MELMQLEDFVNDGGGLMQAEAGLGVSVLEDLKVVWDVGFGVGALTYEVCSGSEGLK